jgi:thiol-disulfide isomerase/thioredoxin
MKAFNFGLQSIFFRATLMLLALAWCSVAAAGDLHPFKSGSLVEIKAAMVGKPFILLFWSVDCASCLKEMHNLAAAIAKHPGLDLVMVSTDDISNGKDVQSVLEKHRLQKVESWAFADSDAQRLRYEIDPAWYGELPRSYFYDAAHNRLPHSGVLSLEHIEAWQASIKSDS